MQPKSFASSPDVRRRMQRQPRESTGPERALRSALHRAGLRFRLHVPVLDGRSRKADIVLARHRAVVFVDGCFWHACPKHGTRPRVNRWYWDAKLEGNRRRDRDTDRRLRAAGWRVVRVWEHEAPTAAAQRIVRWLRERPKKASRPPGA